MKTTKYYITSVGIDIGTSTTKLIVSKLTVAQTASAYSLPRYEIMDRVLQYASQMYSTPLLSQQIIDMDSVSKWIEKEYKKIQLKKEEIQTGAVIITGETANKINAQQVVNSLAEQAGKFVVAIAGTDVEGMLAGKGSGAEERSLRVPGTITNIDIGGGTANVAFFQQGKLINTITFHIGGRLIQLNREGRIQSISPSIQLWLRELGFSVIEGEKISFQDLEAITLSMSKEMIKVLANGGSNINKSSLHLIVGKQASLSLPIMDEIMISGGIGKLMQTNSTVDCIEKVAEFGDIGPLLAKAIQQVLKKSRFRLILPDQTSRATVIGSGMQSMELSGSTVFVSPSVLPLRNLPIVLLEWEDGDQLEILQKQGDRLIEQASRFYRSIDLEKENIYFAISVQGPEIHEYVKLQRLAKALSVAYDKHIPKNSPIIVICEHNMAKALGQALYLASGRRRKIVSLDQILVKQGDYIDIGEPLSEDIVPVIIKTLIFVNKSDRR